MAFTFDSIFAADPNNPMLAASNAAITISDPNDPSKAPVTITDVTGLTLPNPVTVNKNGFGPAFQHATLDRLAWSGGGYSGFFTSYEGMKNEAVAARQAAENAAMDAAAEAAAGVASVVADADAAATSAAASATSAANSAALVGAPADAAIAAAINGAGTETKTALNANYATTTALTSKLDKTTADATYKPRLSAIQRIQAGAAVRVLYPYRVVFLGSSTTVHGGASGPEYGYVTQVIRAFQSEYPSGVNSVIPEAPAQLLSATPDYTPGVKPFNGGIAGTTAANYVPQSSLDGIAVLNPSLFIHAVGSNDWATGVPIATYEANVRATIAAIDSRVTRPAVHVLVHAFPRRDTATPVATWAEYGAALKRIADDSPTGRIYIDASGPFTATGLPATDPYALIGPDDIHGTDRAHALLAAQVIDTLIPPGIRASPLGAEILAIDRFGRADGALGNAEIGGAWSFPSGTWAISGNKVTATAAGVATVATGRADATISATVVRPSVGSQGVAVRVSGANDRLAWYYNGATGIQLAAVTTAGGIELLGGAVPVPANVPVGAASRMRLEVRGTAVRAYLNDVLLVSATLTTAQNTNLSGTAVGLRAGNDFATSGTTFDDVLVTAN